jgi:hypothetical protein
MTLRGITPASSGMLGCLPEAFLPEVRVIKDTP